VEAAGIERVLAGLRETFPMTTICWQRQVPSSTACFAGFVKEVQPMRKVLDQRLKRICRSLNRSVCVKRFGLAEAGFISFGGPAGQISDHATRVGRTATLDFRAQISTRPTTACCCLGLKLSAGNLHRLADDRTWGGMIAGVLFVLPSLFILIRSVVDVYRLWRSTRGAGLFYGIKPP